MIDIHKRARLPVYLVTYATHMSRNIHMCKTSRWFVDQHHAALCRVSHKARTDANFWTKETTPQPRFHSKQPRGSSTAEL